MQMNPGQNITTKLFETAVSFNDCKQKTKE